MSYDIYFVRRDPGESFQDALDRAEDPGEGDNIGGPLSSVELEQWERILPHARAILGDIEEFATEVVREISDEATGVQLSIHPGEISITVPYWHGDEDSFAVMQKVYALAYAVEAETGLEGYDPQLDEPISDAAQSAAHATLSTTSRDVQSGELSSRSGTAQQPSAEERPAEQQAAAPERPRRWWEFWKL